MSASQIRQLLVELGVSQAKEIDLLAIADCVGAQVLYRRLAGCEAQIIGFKDRAIIYVSEGARPNRKRFSTGHELGHWHHHRGQSFVIGAFFHAHRGNFASLQPFAINRFIR